MAQSPWVSIGQLADRTGLSVSAIRFYETKGLVTPIRNSGGQRRFLRADIRRLSFVMIAQQFGFSLGDIRAELDALPNDRPPNKKEWAQIGTGFKEVLNQKINTLTRLRDNLDGCIGCGCLSLENCALYNPEDRAKSLGKGPRYLMGNSASQILDKKPS